MGDLWAGLRSALSLFPDTEPALAAPPHHPPTSATITCAGHDKDGVQRHDRRALHVHAARRLQDRDSRGPPHQALVLLVCVLNLRAGATDTHARTHTSNTLARLQPRVSVRVPPNLTSQGSRRSPPRPRSSSSSRSTWRVHLGLEGVPAEPPHLLPGRCWTTRPLGDPPPPPHSLVPSPFACRTTRSWAVSSASPRCRSRAQSTPCTRPRRLTGATERARRPRCIASSAGRPLGVAGRRSLTGRVLST